ncbi:MAG TPA: DUF3592 domain-containing protein, partial [Terriglobales bacterium]|nr:DUF3592 domain-containing protein [Terriglobales bacterium]
YIWHHWPITQGTVIESKLVQDQNEQGVRMCSAAYRVQYFVDGKSYLLEKKESSSSNDCQAWQNTVYAAKGTHWNVLYQRESPGSNSYINPGFNFDFFFIPIFCFGFAVMFTAFGIAAWKVGASMVKNKIQMP